MYAVKYLWLLFVIPIFTLFLLSACAGGQVSPITPSPDKVTFLFFLTDS
jgi:hypothetical protein